MRDENARAMITYIHSEDRLVQQTFAEYLHDVLGWDSVYAWHHETFGPHGSLGRYGAFDREAAREMGRTHRAHRRGGRSFRLH